MCFNESWECTFCWPAMGVLLFFSFITYEPRVE